MLSVVKPLEVSPDAISNPYLGLDEESAWSKFSDHAHATSAEWQSHLVVDSMHCAACANNVERVLTSIPGIKSAQVNATTKRAKVVWSSADTRPSVWMWALQKAGYAALPVNELHLVAARKREQRVVLWRLLVAGFCMMQVMMYAYPAYISPSSDITPDIKQLLRIASWLLTLPVMFFSAIPFFKNAYQDIKRAQVSMDLPVALGILITFFLSSVATFEPNGWWGDEVYFDSLTMFVFFLLAGRWLEARMRDKTAGALDALSRSIPETVLRQAASGEFERVAVSKLLVSNTVRVLPGEAFPGDGVVIEGETSANEALLTGESQAVAKHKGERVIAGSFNLTSPVLVLIDRLGQDTRYGEIVTLMDRASIDKPRLAKLADRIATPFLILVIVAAAVTCALFWPVDHGKALMAAVAVLIVTCPCALSLATPAAMLASAGALAKKGLLIRDVQAIESVANVDVVVFDKTGTLTDSALQVVALRSEKGVSKQPLLSLATALSSGSAHPVSKAITEYYASEGDGQSNPHDVSELSEIPGKGISAQLDGKPYKLGSAEFCGLNIGAVTEREVYLTEKNRLIATFSLSEKIKGDVGVSVAQLESLGVSVLVLSGDTQARLQQFSQQSQIRHFQAECTPEQKLSRIQSLQRDGRHVAMVGDGINDGPVLSQANVSIAMGAGVPIAQSKADVIVQNNQIAPIVTLIKQARKTMRIVKQNLAWALVYNLVCIPLAVLGYLPAWLAGLGMASSSLLVVMNALRLAKVA
jgi:P-type Cu2+ transporter